MHDSTGRVNGAPALVRGHAALRLAVAALIAFTVVIQLAEALTREDQRATVGNFFSYFTIQSNIIVAVVLAVSGVIQLRRPVGRRLDLVRGAATV